MRLWFSILMMYVLSAMSLMARDSLVVQRQMESRRTPWTVGIQAGPAWHATSFSQLSGVQTCCTQYSNAGGSFLALNGEYELYKAPLGIAIDATASFATYQAPFRTVQDELVDYGGDAYTAQIEHLMSVRFWTTFIGAQLSIPIIWDTKIGIGVQAGIPLSSNYSISEKILSPQQLVFETGSTVRNERSGNVQGSTLFFSMPVHVEFPSIAFAKGWSISPILSMGSTLTSISGDVSWNMTSATIGLKLYRRDTVVHIDTTVIRIDEPTPPTPEPEKIKQQIALLGSAVDSATKANIKDVVMTYSVKRRRLAVLPAVYFDSASAEIPARYVGTSSESMLSGNGASVSDIDINHAILDILARTLVSNPSATVTVIGCHGEDGNPNDRDGLAQARGRVLIDYLRNRYNIAPNRFKLQSRALPERSSSTRTIAGRGENRRVEFVLRNGQYELPVQADTLIVKSPNLVDIQTSVTRPETINRWRLDIVSGNKVLEQRSGVGAPPANIEHLLTMEQQQIVRRSGSCMLTMEVDDAEDGLIRKQVNAFTVTSRSDDDRPFDEFGIVLFDYNSSRVSEDEMPTIRELQQRAGRADYIQITGTADASGNLEYNLKLAEQRAISVARQLKLVEGTYELRNQISEDYPVELPEGRMLGRQVKVIMRAGK